MSWQIKVALGSATLRPDDYLACARDPLLGDRMNENKVQSELPLVREEFGFPRTVCGCAACAAYCHHVTGCLVPADLERLLPAGQDVFAWAELHLRARVDGMAPLLVPARWPDGGACHWLFAGRCTVHLNAPYGCAFFDAHMSNAEEEARFMAGVKAVNADAKAIGLYHQVWKHLQAKNLLAPRKDSKRLAAELNRIQTALCK